MATQNAAPTTQESKMTKSEQREVSRLDLYIAHGLRDTAARAIATLIRSARTTRSANELRAIAARMQLDTHPDFIA
jgi:hypothetical protein